MAFPISMIKDENRARQSMYPDPERSCARPLEKNTDETVTRPANHMCPLEPSDDYYDCHHEMTLLYLTSLLLDPDVSLKISQCNSACFSRESNSGRLPK